MVNDCPSKKEKEKMKLQKETISNLATELNKYEEVYINTLEFKSYAAAKTTCLMTIKAHHSLEGTMFINGKKPKVQCDSGTKGASLSQVRTAFVTTHGLPCIEMNKPSKMLIAIKGSRSKSHKEWTLDLAVGKLQMKDMCCW